MAIDALAPLATSGTRSASVVHAHNHGPALGQHAVPKSDLEREREREKEREREREGERGSGEKCMCTSG